MRNVILHLPPWLSHAKIDSSTPIPPPGKLTIVYLITGNPGLIAYYETFLSLLSEGSGNHAIIAGVTLGGFETSNATTTASSFEAELLHPSHSIRKPIYDLKDQIKLTHDRLDTLVKHLQADYPVIHDLPIEIVLIGHSVGAYISLELVRLQHYRSNSISLGPEQASPFTIAATMHLTPTIVDIAHSPSGRIATPVLSTIPFFPTLLQLGTNVLTSALPVSWLSGMVSRVTGMKSGSQALEVTVAFLRTSEGVKQALHMARSEMAEIGKEEWKEEVWGAVESSVGNDLEGLRQGTMERAGNGRINVCAAKPDSEVETSSAGHGKNWKAPKHYFLFAKEDHWVADTTRDAILNAIGGRATIVVDEPKQGEKGLVHAWCLDQSKLVAEIVDGWLAEVINQG